MEAEEVVKWIRTMLNLKEGESTIEAVRKLIEGKKKRSKKKAR